MILVMPLMSYVSITIGKRSRSPESVDGAMTEQQVDTAVCLGLPQIDMFEN
jgi:hypothetical protein